MASLSRQHTPRWGGRQSTEGGLYIQTRPAHPRRDRCMSDFELDRLVSRNKRPREDWPTESQLPILSSCRRLYGEGSCSGKLVERVALAECESD